MFGCSCWQRFVLSLPSHNLLLCSYKWGFGRWSLERRLLFFETNWAFFAGFGKLESSYSLDHAYQVFCVIFPHYLSFTPGSPCVLATFFFSPLVSAGVMAVLFPLVSILTKFVFLNTGTASALADAFFLLNVCEQHFCAAAVCPHCNSFKPWGHS